MIVSTATARHSKSSSTWGFGDQGLIFYQEEAHQSLVKFLQNAQANGKKCVIIITGRGKISQGGGILQNQTPKWLNSPLLRQSTIAFSAAQARDGGRGAIYVLLRKLR